MKNASVVTNPRDVHVVASSGDVHVVASCFPSFGKGGVGVVCQKMFDRFRKIWLGPCFTYHPRPLLWKRRGVVRLLSIFLNVVLLSVVAPQARAQGALTTRYNIETIDLELVMADLEMVDRRIDKACR